MAMERMIEAGNGEALEGADRPGQRTLRANWRMGPQAKYGSARRPGMFATAFLDLPPLEAAGGTVRLPGSKSISNRVLLLAALCDGTTAVHDLLDSDDTRVMLDALRALGCGVRARGRRAVEVTGFGGRAPGAAGATLFLGNAGTAMRPLTAALAAARRRLRAERRAAHARAADRRPGRCAAPARLPHRLPRATTATRRCASAAATACNSTRPIRVRGDVSSQFLTALLLALPLVATPATS